MAKTYKLYPIKTIKDWEGEDWDVYMEIKTLYGFNLYRGWPYGTRPNDENMNGVFQFILTTELANFCRNHGSVEVRKCLKISGSVIYKFRRRLNILKEVKKRDYEWITEHQTEILNESYLSLRNKYGLSRSQIDKYSVWLVKEQSAKRQNKQRITLMRHLREEWYRDNFKILKKLDAKSMQQQFNLSRTMARNTYDRVSKEIERPSLVENH